MKPVKGERMKVFSDSLNQGDEWRHGNGNILSNLVDWQVEFEEVVMNEADKTVKDLIKYKPNSKKRDQAEENE